MPVPFSPGVSVANAAAWGQTGAGPAAAIGCTTPTAASQTLTFSGNAVAGETFSVGPITYTWTSTSSVISGQSPNFVLVGADAEHSIINAAAAITGTASKGTLFSNGTQPNPSATAVATSTTVLTASARGVGADGNVIAVSETMSNAAWAAATLAGGTGSALYVTGLPPGGTPVTGIAEVLTGSAALSAASTTITAGALSISVVPLTGFVGTIAGSPWADVADSTHAGGTFTYTAQPGNTLPAVTITRSAGSYVTLQSRPA